MAPVTANIEGLDQTEEVIVGTMVEMINEEKDLTSSGKPESPALGERVGFNVSADERDELMTRIIPGDGPPEEPPVEGAPDPKDDPSTAKPPEEEAPAPKAEKEKKLTAREMIEQIVELSVPPRRNQTHLRPPDQQRLVDIQALAQDLLAAVKKR